MRTFVIVIVVVFVIAMLSEIHDLATAEYPRRSKERSRVFDAVVAVIHFVMIIWAVAILT